MRPSLGETLLTVRAEAAQRFKAERGTLEGFRPWWDEREPEFLLEAKQRLDSGGKPLPPPIPEGMMMTTAERVAYIERHGIEAYQRATEAVAGKDTDMVFDLNDKNELVDETGTAVTINGAPVRVRRNMPMETEQFTAHALTVCGSRFKNAALDILPKLRDAQKDGAFVINRQRLDLCGAINAIAEANPHYVATPATDCNDVLGNPWHPKTVNITEQHRLIVSAPELAKRLQHEARLA